MPVRSGAAFLLSSLNSMAAGMAADDEIVVIDDHSHDETPKILESFARKNPFFSWYKNPGVGLVDALNFGVKQSNTKWIARFDVDDCYPKNRLEKQRFLISDEVSAVFADYQVVSSRGENLGIIPSSVFDIPTKISLFNSAQTAHPVSIFNRDHFVHVGGYHQEDFPAEDLGLWLRLSREGKFVTVPEVLLKYRLSPGSTSMVNQSLVLKQKHRLLNEIGLPKGLLKESEVWLESVSHIYNHLPMANIREAIAIKNHFDYKTEQCGETLFNWQRNSLILTALGRNPVSSAKLLHHQLRRHRYRTQISSPMT